MYDEVVAKALGSDVTAVRIIARKPLDYDAYMPHRTLTRVHGYALVDGVQTPWAMIEKQTRGPALASAYLTDNARREYSAYTSGVLNDLVPHIGVPRVYGTDLDPEGGITLWLEEVQHDGPRPLTKHAILNAARDLGTMAGRWSGHDLEEPWYFTGWIDRHAQPQSLAQGLITLRGATPTALTRLGPDRLAVVERSMIEQSRIRHILESSPRTLCHHDAVGANVFIAGSERTVLIDWESIGPGPIAADLASLLFSSVRRGDASAEVVASVLDEAIDTYITSCRTEAAHIKPGEIRRAFDAAVALRWKLAVDVVAIIGAGGQVRRGSLPDEPQEAAMADLVRLVDILAASTRLVLD